MYGIEGHIHTFVGGKCM